MNATYEMISAEDAAKRLGISRCTMYKWINFGWVNATNIGDGVKRPRWQIRDVDLEAAIVYKKEHYRKHKKSGANTTIEVIDIPKVKDVATESKLDPTAEVLKEMYRENRELRERIKELEEERKQFVSALLETLIKFE